MSRLEHPHDSASIRRRLAAGPHVSYLRDLVYGGIDGAITTLAVVAGAMGADLSARVVLIMGMANLVGDGFSMAAANFSGTRAEVDEYARLRAMEERHLDLVPEGEREEVRQIYRRKGFEAGDLERAVAVVTADRARWIDAMMTEEHGQPTVLRTPWKAALGTFAAFLLCGSIPLLPFAAGLRRQLLPVARCHGPRLLRHRLRQEPLVGDELVALGAGDAGDRPRRRRPRLRGRLWPGGHGRSRSLTGGDGKPRRTSFSISRTAKSAAPTPTITSPSGRPTGRVSNRACMNGA